MRKAGKAAVIGMSMLAVVVMATCSVYASTREENIQKITQFLNDESVKKSIALKGGDTEKIITKLASLNDKQLEKLANHANLQVGGNEEAVNDFWKTQGTIYLISAITGLLLLIVVLAAA